MPQTWTRLRESALDSVTFLKELLRDNSAEDKRLIAAYLEAKQILAEAFEALAVEKYYDSSVLDNVKKILEREMRESFRYLPNKYLKIRGFGTSHAKLLAYLSKNVGSEVTAATLRMLTADASETERRTRELRELGFDLIAGHTGGSDFYTLSSATPDAAKGAAVQVTKNINADKKISSVERERLLGLVGQSQ